MNTFRTFRPPENFPPVVKNLLIINVLVYLAQRMLDAQYGVTMKIALYTHHHPNFEWYQLITHMFAHSPSFIFHIFFNMFALWMFGRVLENVWGSKRFIIFYFACGFGAAALHLFMQHLDFVQMQKAIQANNVTKASELAAQLSIPALGASGAVMGIFVAFAFLFPNTPLYLMFIPFPIKAKWLVLGLAAFDIFGGVRGGSNVAHFAHLGGALTGFVIVYVWNKTNRRRFY